MQEWIRRYTDSGDVMTFPRAKSRLCSEKDISLPIGSKVLRTSRDPSS